MRKLALSRAVQLLRSERSPFLECGVGREKPTMSESEDEEEVPNVEGEPLSLRCDRAEPSVPLSPSKSFLLGVLRKMRPSRRLSLAHGVLPMIALAFIIVLS